MLITRRLSPDVIGSGLGAGVEYRPGPLDENDAAQIGAHQSVWVLDPTHITAAGGALHSWLSAVLARDGQPALVSDDLEALAAYTDSNVELIGPLRPQGSRPLELALLAAAERAELQRCCNPRWRELGIGSTIEPWPTSRRVCLIGAGIVNLITALALVEAGFTVEVIDGGSDPRARGNWQTQGATCGGENARMFCFTEADNYNEKSDRVYADMLTAFNQRISGGGWLVETEGTNTDEFRAWRAHFESVPAWRAKIFADDIHEVNRMSAPLWSRMREHHPTLFEDVTYTDGVLRLYSEAEAFEAAIATQTRVGALRRLLRPTELGRKHPGLASACANGAIAGGIEVTGFTLNIHDFVDGLLDQLEAMSVRFTWQTRATWAREAGTISGLCLDNGEFRVADHYVASPGAHGNELLVGTSCEGMLTGIAGLWMVMPNLDPPLRHSLKIHREGHVGEDSNVTLARDRQGREILILGSGYAVIGQQSKLELDGADLDALYAELTETVRRFFPDHHRLGPEVGWRISRRGCVRPFTPTGLGLFDGFASTHGLALITGGHNTGGFAQAPTIAEAVVHTLRGQTCAMQHTFAPRRGIT